MHVCVRLPLIMHVSECYVYVHLCLCRVVYMYFSTCAYGCVRLYVCACMCKCVRACFAARRRCWWLGDVSTRRVVDADQVTDAASLRTDRLTRRDVHVYIVLSARLSCAYYISFRTAIYLKWYVQIARTCTSYSIYELKPLSTRPWLPRLTEVSIGGLRLARRKPGWWSAENSEERWGARNSAGLKMTST